MKWIPQHNFLSVCLAIIIVMLSVTVIYIDSKLNLIQYDHGDSSPIVSTVSEEENFEPLLSDTIIAELPQVDTQPEIPDSPVWNDSDVLNVLLIGTDERSDEFSENARSDSMILISANKKTKEIKLISLERAIGVPVLSGPYKGQYDWLTHIFRYGGSELLLETVQSCFAVKIDHYVRINFHSVVSAIDAIGGVDIVLTQAEADYLNDPNAMYMWHGHEPRPVVAGLNRVDGLTALTYSRIRAIDSDWQRVERQRKVIIAASEQLLSSGLSGLDELANHVLPLVQTNFTKAELAELMFLAPTFLNLTIDQMTIPVEGTYGVMTGMGDRSLFAVDFEANAEILQNYLYGLSMEHQND